ncbi:MAG TPA: LPS assembly lipoprotein LptE [Saprospiraceae bacterium]|nr:LPS assembly lipoprotein LptE [Saprospiraceae bacterium]
MNRKTIWPFVVLALWMLSGCCYTFKGISIDPDVNTFFVQNFEGQAPTAPPTLPLEFTERLKDKVRLESRLTLKNTDADVEFTGKVVEFRVVPVAPKPGEQVALNRLEVGVSVQFIHNKNDKKSWPSARTFRHFAEFDNSEELLSVQNQLLTQTIYPQILEDIFNAAFNDW